MVPSCTLHVSLLFTQGNTVQTFHNSDTYTVDVVWGRGKYHMRVFRGLKRVLPYKSLGQLYLGPMIRDISGPELMQLLNEVPTVTPLVEPSDFSCWSWASDVLFKLHMREYILHEQWAEARQWVGKIAKRGHMAGYKWHVGGPGPA